MVLFTLRISWFLWFLEDNQKAGPFPMSSFAWCAFGPNGIIEPWRNGGRELVATPRFFLLWGEAFDCNIPRSLGRGKKFQETNQAKKGCKMQDFAGGRLTSDQNMSYFIKAYLDGDEGTVCSHFFWPFFWRVRCRVCLGWFLACLGNAGPAGLVWCNMTYLSIGVNWRRTKHGINQLATARGRVP